jgi:murein DD-endopeptidase MepM/ murein hydrolase activator NlpD
LSSYPSRDLGSHELWRRSLERSLHRRAIAPAARRQAARRKHSALAVTAAMMAAPTAPFAVAANGSGSESDVPAQGTNPSAGADAQANVLLQRGSTGPAVARLQARLGVAQDSVFGPATEAAVRAFQAAQGLTVDGVVGPATWAALFGGAGTSGVAGDGSATATERAEAELAVQRLDGDDSEPVVAFQANLSDVEEAAKEEGARKIEEPAAPAPDRSGSHEHRGDTKRKASGEDQPAENRGSGGGETRPVNDEGSGQTAACGGSLVNPLRRGTVTSPFGPRGGRLHAGLDIAAPSGTPIRAAQCGVVTFAGWQGGYGNIVCIRHTSTFVTCYAHMSRFSASVGDRVEAGDVIGYVGCTGSCTGPHVHFETRVNGRARDPRQFLGGGRMPGRASARPAVQRRPSSRPAARTRPASRTRPAPAPVPATGGGTSQASTTIQPPEEQWVAEQQAATAQPAQPVATTQPAQPVATAQPQPTATAEVPVGGPETAPAQPEVAEVPVDDGSSAPDPVQGDGSTEVSGGTVGAAEAGQVETGTADAGGASGSAGAAESGSAGGGASGNAGSTAGSSVGATSAQGTPTASGTGASGGAPAGGSTPAQTPPTGASDSAAPAEAAATGTP